MNLKVTTVYDGEQLLNLNRFHQFGTRQKKVMWVLLVLLEVFLIGESIVFLRLRGFLDPLTLVSFGAMLILTQHLYKNLILPKLNAKNSVVETSTVTYYFREDAIHADLVSKSSKEHLVIPYSKIFYVEETNGCLYLMMTEKEAYILDKKGIKNGSAQELKDFLSTKLPGFKLKFKDDNGE